jgi:hypothetical protein
VANPAGVTRRCSTRGHRSQRAETPVTGGSTCLRGPALAGPETQQMPGYGTPRTRHRSQRYRKPIARRSG